MAGDKRILFPFRSVEKFPRMRSEVRHRRVSEATVETFRNVSVRTVCEQNRIMFFLEAVSKRFRRAREITTSIIVLIFSCCVRVSSSMFR